MDQREKKLRRVAFKCADFARQLSYHRTLDKYKDDLALNFGISIYNNAIDIAVLDWFHLFGYAKDHLHWKKVIKDKNAFKQGLLIYLGITEQAWQSYWKNVKKYRDKDVAHIEIRPVSNVPEMSIALKATNYYYEIVLRELTGYNNFSGWPSDLLEYHRKSLEQSKNIAAIAYKATRSIDEKVF